MPGLRMNRKSFCRKMYRFVSGKTLAKVVQDNFISLCFMDRSSTLPEVGV
jgi:hypothetical protein